VRFVGNGVFRRSTGSRSGTTNQELLVYHRRSLQEREEAASRKRAYREGLAVDALLELEINMYLCCLSS
jgi:hypothetical protein